jgi:uncharacterized membrane protein YbhN (UPF0104 family)
MRRLLLLLLKATISILLLYLSLRAVNLAALGERLSRIEPAWIAAAFLLAAMQVCLLAFRWRTIVAQCGLDVRLTAALRMSFIAMFFNSVLPSTVGGDAARMVMLKRVAGGGWANAAYSVVIDRIAGVTALALVVLVCLPWTLQLVQDPVARALLVLIGGGAVLAASVFMALGARRWPLLERWAATRHLAEVSRVAGRVCRDRRFTAIAAASFVIHITTIAITWCIAQSVAASASFMLLLFLVPPVLLVATVPVSIAGWGLREGSMIVAFAYAGLAQGDGLIVSVLFGLLSFAVGIIGGLIWIAGDLRLSALQSDAAKVPSRAGPE